MISVAYVILFLVLDQSMTSVATKINDKLK